MTTQFHSQTAKFIATVAQNMPALSGPNMQYWIENPAELHAALVRVFAREPNEQSRTDLILNCSQRLNPLEFLGEGWTIVEQDERSLALTEVDFSKVSFETCLTGKETRIKGEEKLKRLKAMEGAICHGGSQFLALWKDYQERGQNSVLERLRKERGIRYIDFFGLVLRDPDGRHHVLYLCWRGGLWRWRYRWLGSDWDAAYRSVCSQVGAWLESL